MPAADAWPDVAGRLAEGRHRLAVRVYFEDTDFSGVVYHGAYVRFLERGRSDMLRLLGVAHADLAAGRYGEPLYWAIRTMTLGFRAPATIDDVLEVVSWPAESGRARFVIGQEVRRDGSVMLEAQVEALLIGADRRPRRIPASLRDQLAGAADAARN